MEISVEEPIDSGSTVIYTGVVNNTIQDSSNEEVIIFELPDYNSITFIFTQDEFNEFRDQNLAILGKNGKCNVCEEPCDDSYILNLQYDFFTFCGSCYQQIRTELEKSYDRNRSKIISQLL